MAQVKKYETIISHFDANNVLHITLNRPEARNAVNVKMFDELSEELKRADKMEECKFVVLTGSGKFYCSGNDLNNFLSDDAHNRKYMFRDFVRVLINMTKPIVVLVNGPAVGLAVTTLPLCDLVIASDKATFHCPFTKLALCPEGCSSFTFPQIMGNSRATEMLMFNKKASAQEMNNAGLVSLVIPDEQFIQFTRQIVEEYGRLSAEALKVCKSLVRTDEVRAKLHKVNDQESDILAERFTSPEAVNAVMAFFSAKSRL